MTFIGDLEFVEGRSPSETTAIVLRKCLEGRKSAGEKGVNGLLEGLAIKPEAFFKEIDGDWMDKPFVGQHVFKVAQAAGYGGTENDLWLTVTGGAAPYATKERVKRAKKPAAAKPKAAAKAATKATAKTAQTKPTPRRSAP